MSRGSSSSTTASSSTPWSRARRSASTTRRADASRCMRLRRACSACAATSPTCSSVAPEAGARPDRQCRRLVRHEAAPFPEYVCVLHAARALGRPVKWTDERSGSFVSDSHGRDHELDRRARARHGRQLPRRCASPATAISAPTSRTSAPLPSTLNIVKNVQSVYRTPLIEVSTKCVFTNTSPIVRLSRRRPARGQLLHGAADRRRRRRDGHRPRSSCAGATTSGRASCRYKTRVGQHLRQRRLPARAQARRWRSPTGRASRAASARARKRGKLRGLGIGSYLEVTAPPTQGDGRHPLRGRRHGHHHHRHARLRPGPLPRRSRRC